jgi:hypothetical protein
LADLARVEIPPLLVGTTTTGEYTPAWVKTWPDTSALRDEQLAGRNPERLDAASLPSDSTFAPTVRNALSSTYLLNLATDATLVYRTFYFPGWQADLDGRPLPVRPSDPEGLIAFDVPAGEHAFTLRFASTPIRRAAGGLSIAGMGLLVVAAVLIGGAIHQSHVTRHMSQFVSLQPAPTNNQLPITDHRLPSAPGPRAVGRITDYLILCILVILAKLAFLDTGLLPLVRHGLRSGVPTSMQHSLGLDFAGELELLGYDLTADRLAAGEGFGLNLYWRAQHELGLPYGLSTRLVDGRGLSWSPGDIKRPRDFRFFPGADNWPADQYILDPYVIDPLPGIPPGAYDVEVLAYRQSDLQAIGSARIAQVQITSPERASGAPAEPLAVFGDGLALDNYEFDRQAAAPGDPVLVRLTWRALAPVNSNRLARLDLVAASSGEVSYAHEHRIVETYPTGRWEPAEVFAEQLWLRLPASLETDTYEWRLTVLEQAGQPLAGPVPLPLPSGAFMLTAPERIFTLPEIAHPLDTRLGDSVMLRGYNLSSANLRPGEPVTVSLVWQAEAEMPVSYHVFLHLLDAATGAIVAQSDGVPAGWTRPTTGWVAGEVVIDDRVLSLEAALPPGDYELWAGLVNPETGERLPVPGLPDGRVRLGILTHP